MLRALWRFRFFIISSIKNELTSSFKRSSIGSIWVVLNPLANVLIYALVLSKVIAAKLPNNSSPFSYSIYLMAGLLCWNLFNEILMKSSNVFIANSQGLKNMQYPRSTIPAILYGSSILNNFLLFLSMFLIISLIQYPVSYSIFFIPILSLILGLFSVSIGIIFGIINVFIRDVSQVLTICLQLLFWFTPIVYPENIIPDYLRSFVKINPLYHFAKIYQEIICLGAYPDFSRLFFLVVLTLTLMFFSIKFYRLSINEIVDSI